MRIPADGLSDFGCGVCTNIDHDDEPKALQRFLLNRTMGACVLVSLCLRLQTGLLQTVYSVVCTAMGACFTPSYANLL